MEEIKEPAKKKQAPAPVSAPEPAAPVDAEEDDEEPEAAPVVAEPVIKAPVHHMTKAERDGYYETSELAAFGKEEDAAIKVQLNG